MSLITYLYDLKRGNEKINSTLDRQNAIAEQNNRIMEDTNKNISHLNANLDSGLAEINGGIKNVHNAIESFRKDFNMTMGAVSIQIEMQRKEMQQGLSNIENILKNKRKTDALEDFQDAVEYYNDGLRFPGKTVWFKNAYKYFNESIEKYERNPLAHLYLGHIYHYHEDFRDFDKALYHYELCSAYGEADEENNALTAQGYLYAGWIIAAVKEDIEEGIRLTKKAIEFDDSFAEAYYNLVTFYAFIYDFDTSKKYLEKLLLEVDNTYYFRFQNDDYFNLTRDKYDQLLTILKAKTFNKSIAIEREVGEIINSIPIGKIAAMIIHGEIYQLVEPNYDTYAGTIKTLRGYTQMKEELLTRVTFLEGYAADYLKEEILGLKDVYRISEEYKIWELKSIFPKDWEAKKDQSIEEMGTDLVLDRYRRLKSRVSQN